MQNFEFVAMPSYNVFHNVGWLPAVLMTCVIILFFVYLVVLLAKTHEKRMSSKTEKHSVGIPINVKPLTDESFYDNPSIENDLERNAGFYNIDSTLEALADAQKDPSTQENAAKIDEALNAMAGAEGDKTEKGAEKIDNALNKVPDMVLLKGVQEDMKDILSAFDDKDQSEDDDE